MEAVDGKPLSLHEIPEVIEHTVIRQKDLVIDIDDFPFRQLLLQRYRCTLFLPRSTNPTIAVIPGNTVCNSRECGHVVGYELGLRIRSPADIR